MNIAHRYNSATNSWEVSLSGEVDVYNAPQLKDALHSLLDEKVADMIIDCKELKYIDSTGLGVLIGVLKRIKDNNGNDSGNITITNLKPYIEKIFKITGLDKNIFDRGAGIMGEDRVYLRVPAKPEYILVIRLTTSAVATRAGFDVDEIEDIKVAVAEAGTVIMNQKNGVGTIELSYKIAGVNGIWIHISAPETEEVTIPYTENEQAELSFYIMESLMDNVERNEKDGFIRELKMYKEFGG